MKNLMLIAIIVFLSLNTAIAQHAFTELDRKSALAYLEMSKVELLTWVEGLSTEQLRYKASSDSWSVEECVEHLAVSEKFIFQNFSESLKTQPETAEKPTLPFTDEGIINLISDRSQKVKTIPDLAPANRFGSFKASLKSYLTERENHIQFIRDTQEDLRSHYFQFPFGMTDSYQVILFLAAHNMRHTQQIKEVIQNPDFPGSI